MRLPSSIRTAKAVSKLPILQYPDPRLRTKAAPVEVAVSASTGTPSAGARPRTKATPVEIVDDTIRGLVDDLFDTMYAAPGIGLAASQVNVHKRVLVVDVSERRDEPRAFINPVIEFQDGVQEREEGCLSVPGFYETVQRANRIRVTALNVEGEPFTLDAEDLLAVCIQHECDHLDGKLFVDYISSLKRQRIKTKLRKLARSDKARR